MAPAGLVYLQPRRLKGVCSEPLSYEADMVVGLGVEPSCKANLARAIISRCREPSQPTKLEAPVRFELTFIRFRTPLGYPVSRRGLLKLVATVGLVPTIPFGRRLLRPLRMHSATRLWCAPSESNREEAGFEPAMSANCIRRTSKLVDTGGVEPH